MSQRPYGDPPDTVCMYIHNKSHVTNRKEIENALRAPHESESNENKKHRGPFSMQLCRIMAIKFSHNPFIGRDDKLQTLDGPRKTVTFAVLDCHANLLETSISVQLDGVML